MSTPDDEAPIHCTILLDDSGNPSDTGLACGQPAIDYGRNVRDGRIVWAVCAAHDAEYAGAVTIDERRLPTWQAGLYVSLRDHCRYRLASFGVAISDAQLATLASGLIEHMETPATFAVVAAWLGGLSEHAKRERTRAH